MSPSAFVSYWLEKDSRVVAAWLPELARLRTRGVRVHLATNQEHVRAAYLMDTLGLAAHVDGMLYSARLGARKPDVAFFAKAEAASGVPASELLLVDDSPDNVEAARRAGWHAIRWRRDSRPGAVTALCAGGVLPG